MNRQVASVAALAAVVVAVFAAEALGGGSRTVVFDSTGDVGAWVYTGSNYAWTPCTAPNAADIGSVAVSNDTSGNVTFAVTFANQDMDPIKNGQVRVYVFRRPFSPGDEDIAEVFSGVNGAFRSLEMRNVDWLTRRVVTSVSGSTLSMTVRKDDLAVDDTFDYTVTADGPASIPWLAPGYTNQASECGDFVPNLGTQAPPVFGPHAVSAIWPGFATATHSMSRYTNVPLRITHIITDFAAAVNADAVDRRPFRHGGETFLRSATLTLNNLYTVASPAGAGPTDLQVKYSCSATIAGRRVPAIAGPSAALAGYCEWRLPVTSTGQTMVVRVTAKYNGVDSTILVTKRIH